MAQERHVYGEVHNKTDLRKIFTEIRHNVDGANSRPALTELYKRAGYLITLSYAPSWQTRFGDEASTLRGLAKDEFSTTARKINRRAKKINTEPDYDETWGE